MLRSRKPGAYEEALIHLKQVHNANCHHLVINHKLKLTILTNYKLWLFLMKILLTEQSYFVVIPKVWDVRADQVVRSINGPYICGEGIDIWEDSVLTASWVAHDSLQVHFRLTANSVLFGSSVRKESRHSFSHNFITGFHNLVISTSVLHSYTRSW